MRPKQISIPLERPEVCAACPLLGRRPASELRKGDKFTLRCMMPDIDRVISGRGSKKPDARNRCKPKEWRKLLATYAGDVPVSATDYERYQLGTDAWLFERDKLNNQKTKTPDATTEAIRQTSEG